MITDDAIREIAAAHIGVAGALTPVLVALNRRFGHVPPAAEQIVADVLNLSRADVAGAISFYSDFRTRPPGAVVVQICRSEACQAAGGDALAAHAETQLGCAFGETSGDGAATLDAVYCFGNCALAPAAAVNGRLLGRTSMTLLDAAIADAGALPE